MSKSAVILVPVLMLCKQMNLSGVEVSPGDQLENSALPHLHITVLKVHPSLCLNFSATLRLVDLCSGGFQFDIKYTIHEI